MTVFLIVLTVGMLTCRSTCMKIVADRNTGAPQMSVIFGSAAVFSLAFASFMGLPIHASTVRIAVIYGVCNFLSQFLSLKAMEAGKASNVVFVCSCSFLVSSVYSIAVFKDRISLFRAAGIILVVIAQVFFCFFTRREDGRKEKGCWLGIALASMFFSGVVGIVQKYMSYTAYSNEFVALSIVASLTSTLLAISCVALRKQWPMLCGILSEKKACFFCVLLGLCAAVLNVLSTRTIAMVDGSLVFPIFNCGSLILSLIVARIRFGDKLSKGQKISIATGILAISIIGL